MTKGLKSLLFQMFTLCIHSLISQNVLVSDVGNPNEPSIMMDPSNLNVLVAGSNLHYVYRSGDGGKTWLTDSLTSSYGVWGDPVIDVDKHGNFYFFHLSNTPGGNWIDRIVCQKSLDKGQTWSDGTYTGLNDNKVQDKQWSVIDRRSGNIYLTWTQFDKYKSNYPLDSSIILFSKSTDGGLKWSEPKRLNSKAGGCLDNDNTVEGATPAIGPNGEVYVSWAGPTGIIFTKSSNEGNTWNEEILVNEMPFGWDHFVTGLYRANGLPITKCDTSFTFTRGTIYICWADQRNGEFQSDIWLSKSLDQGASWSNPIRVNDDPVGNYNFLPWMDIDQTTGYLYFIFYDRRNYSNGSHNTDVYMARSIDGGITFENKKISDSLFVPDYNVFFGDYTNIVAHNNVVRPIWARMDNGKLSIWTNISPIDSIFNNKTQDEEVSDRFVQYPNPSNGITYISFKLHEKSIVSLYIYDALGKKVETVFENKNLNYGKFVYKIDLSEFSNSNGEYFSRLKINDHVETKKIILVK